MSTTTTGTTTSPDGTPIGWTRTGDGPGVVLVDGALCYRGAGPLDALAAALAGRFAVWTYDRRGRRASGDTPPFAAEREIEDLRAVVGLAAGDGASGVGLFGHSSGAALALLTAAEEPVVTCLVLHEPPLLTAVLGEGTRSAPGRTRRLCARRWSRGGAGTRSRSSWRPRGCRTRRSPGPAPDRAGPRSRRSRRRSRTTTPSSPAAGSRPRRRASPSRRWCSPGARAPTSCRTPPGRPPQRSRAPSTGACRTRRTLSSRRSSRPC
ncbi:alpha/beta fold hydrolase [Luteimicrobium album]|uniref:alpha/beta fold hydrolase n=1 Tax=Luteimicrobium album TaxID=1054550 RepID=UPI003D674699